MATFRFTQSAHRQFEKLDPQIQKRMKEKLEELKAHPSIVAVLEPIQNLEPATHRLRIGEYRLLVAQKDTTCIVYKIGHRRDVYK